jgi:Sigma-70, region 4
MRAPCEMAMVTSAFRCFSRTIEIPAKLHGRPLEMWQTSARLTALLRRSGIRVLGDLQGRRVVDFARERNCGAKTLYELDSLTRRVACERGKAKNTGASGNGTPPHNGAGLAIPESVCQLQFDELPISTRLANVVESMGARSLGDLKGLRTFELLRHKQCGWCTFGEIEQLIERAISGDFDAHGIAHLSTSAAAVELLSLLEQGIAKLSPRKREFLLARIGAESRACETCLSYAEIGRRCGLTRSRVQQVAVRALESLRKSSGPRVPRLLEMIKWRCLSIPNASRLTPRLLRQWIGESPKRFQLSIEAHVRLIAALDKNIPGCPVGDWQSRGRAKSSPDAAEARATKRAPNFFARSALAPRSESHDPIGTTFDWSAYGPTEPECLSNSLPRQNGSRCGPEHLSQKARKKFFKMFLPNITVL